MKANSKAVMVHICVASVLILFMICLLVVSEASTSLCSRRLALAPLLLDRRDEHVAYVLISLIKLNCDFAAAEAELVEAADACARRRQRVQLLAIRGGDFQKRLHVFLLCEI